MPSSIVEAGRRCIGASCRINIFLPNVFFLSKSSLCMHAFYCSRFISRLGHFLDRTLRRGIARRDSPTPIGLILAGGSTFARHEHIGHTHLGLFDILPYLLALPIHLDHPPMTMDGVALVSLYERQIRPDDASFDPFGQGLDTSFDQFFDQCMVADRLSNEVQSPSGDTLGPSGTSFEWPSPSLGNYSAGTPWSSPSDEGRLLDLRQPWRLPGHAIPAYYATSPSPHLEGSQSLCSLAPSGRASIADSEPDKLEHVVQIPLSIPATSPLSTTSSRSANSSRNAPRSSASVSSSIRRRDQIARGRVCRKHSPSSTPSKMMLGSPYRTDTMANIPKWSQNFDLANSRYALAIPPTSLPLSPPPSAKLPGCEESHHSSLQSGHAQGQTHLAFAYQDISPCQSFDERTASHFTPLASPRTTLSEASRPNLDRDPTSGGHHFSTTPYSGKADDSALSPSTPNEPLAFDFSSSPDYANSQAPQWWAASAPVTIEQPAPQDFHGRVQRASKTLMQMTGAEFDMGNSPQDLATQGLMISCGPSTADGAEEQVLGSDLGAPAPAHDYFSMPTFHAAAATPLLTPAAGQTKQSQSRTPSPGSTPARAGRRGRQPAGATPRTPGTPAVGFVNYTPHDSDKILHGVAPSGSSKTKARREKEAVEKRARWEREAREKRRKLSAAAERAVRAAGGDVGVLHGALHGGEADT